MKKHNKTALVKALGLAGASLLAAAPALATETRINSLSAGGSTFGGSGAIFNEKSVTIQDSSNINSLPQYLPKYKNSVDTDATQGAKYGSMSVRYALSDEAVLLLYGKSSAWAPVATSKSIGGSDAATAAGYSPSGQGIKDPTNHQFGVGFGMKAGENLRFGARLDIGGSRNDLDTNKLDSNTLIDFNAGVGFDLNETNNLDFGLNIRVGSFVNQDNNSGSALDRYVGDGLFGVGLLAKGEFQVHQIAKLVPYFRFGYDARGVAHFARSDEQGSGNEQKRGHLTDTQINLGADLAISPVEGVLIQPGVGLAFRSTSLAGNDQPGPQGSNISEHDLEKARQMLPFYGFAAEAKAFDWMVLRLAARQTIIKTDTDNVAQQGKQTTEFHASDVTNVVSTGVGLKLMGWKLDLNVAPAFFNNGIYAVSGGTGTTPFAIDWALGYDW